MLLQRFFVLSLFLGLGLTACTFVGNDTVSAALQPEAGEAEEAAAAETEEVEAEEATEDAAEEEEEEAAEETTQESATEAKSEESKERKTHKVEAKPLKITADIEGIFTAREAAEVILRPEEWSDFEIVEIVPHGRTVSKGEVLIKFESKKLDEAIEDLELELRLSELAMMKAEQELPRATEEVEKSYEQAQRALDEAKADYARYRDVEREMSLKSAAMSLKSVEQSVENTQEELAQLEKMYEADDLTEETEEIVLKRQRAAVEQAEFRLEMYKDDYQQTIDVEIPRRDIREKESLDQVQLAFDRAKTALETDRSSQQYELEQKRQARLASVEKHAKLVTDRALLEVRSPAEGVVYYGGATDGEWGETASLIGSLKVHGSAPPEKVIMTIVKTRPMYVIGTLGEDVRASVEIGQQATITTASDDGPKFTGKLEKLSPIPIGEKKYRVELSVEGDDLPEWLVPGLTAKAKLTTYTNDKALLVPKSAIKSEEGDEQSKYVMLVDGENKDAEPKKQPVKVGKSKDDNVEVTEGLSEGDEVILEAEEKKE